MKDAVKQIVGKTIRGVVVSELNGPPYTQVFILFDDDTYFEFYGSDGRFSCAGGLDPGGLEKVRTYISHFPESKIKWEFSDSPSEQRALPADPST